jgi:UDP-N-acetylglucosamine 2-epimerase (non-hydrolysing)
MIDSLAANRAIARTPQETLRSAGFSPKVLDHPKGFGVVTLHRPSNVDQPETLEPLLKILADISAQLPLVFALHPRTRAKITQFGLEHLVDNERMIVMPPQGYLEMLGLMAHATVVLTDSGGVQEETTALGVPCLTLRENTERQITVEQGTNTLVGRDREAILSCIGAILAGGGKRGRVPELWDGRASERIAADIAQWLTARAVKATA